LVNTNDAEAMAEKIAGLLADPALCARLSNNARAKAESFSWEQVKPLWKKLFSGVVVP
jgi:glycosyltransferase involved in cell wall biosynthesis